MLTLNIDENTRVELAVWIFERKLEKLFAWSLQKKLHSRLRNPEFLEFFIFHCRKSNFIQTSTSFSSTLQTIQLVNLFSSLPSHYTTIPSNDTRDAHNKHDTKQRGKNLLITMCKPRWTSSDAYCPFWIPFKTGAGELLWTTFAGVNCCHEVLGVELWMGVCVNGGGELTGVDGLEL